MKQYTKSILMFLFLLVSLGVKGQLSPGPLAKAHSDLEGLSNCLKCHVVGSKVSNQKCLECHTHLQERIDKRKGYHSSKEVKGKECAECHSDHHGINFEMIRFDEDLFDHDLTGYVLEGAHESIDCKKCHTPDYIKHAELRNRPNTFLGLGQDCLSCHDDYHQNTLDKDCLSCHSMKEFKSAPNFDHSQTEFPLKGEHKNTDCKDCHNMTTRNQQEFQEFADVKHDNCTSCHQDVHEGTLGSRCISCHSETGFNSLNKRFNHNSTGFELQGAHKNISCKSCHNSSSQLTSLFQEYVNVAQNDCISCHEDIHMGKFGTDCLQCHTVESFRYNFTPESFDHGLTSFPLTGKHAGIDCKTCHKENLTDPLAHEECRSCHENYHENTFTEYFLDQDCASCHDVEGFSPSSFDMSEHEKTSFPLLGAHQATPCFLCHQSKEEWEFKSLSTECVACHEDIHKGFLAQEYYPQSDCRHCHSETAWKNPVFDHDKTSYKLVGKHQSVDCKSCHIPDNTFEQNAASPVFDVSSECRDCHSDNHRGQFDDLDQLTDCNSCHNPHNWDAVYFNHDSTRFKLDGAHIEIDCKACHYTINDEEGEYTLYSLNTIECSDCH